MKTSIKTFVYAAMVSIAFLACNDTTGFDESGDDNKIRSSVVKESPLPYDPPLLIVADDVEEWKEDQLASKGNEKRLISVFDMYRADTESTAEFSATIDSDGKVEYFLNGEKISAEEYQNRWKYERQIASYSKRNLSIPGEIIHDTSSRWTVLITAEELVELSKKYDKLAIEFYIEYVDE
jgi:hypothetical protein